VLAVYLNSTHKVKHKTEVFNWLILSGGATFVRDNTFEEQIPALQKEILKQSNSNIISFLIWCCRALGNESKRKCDFELRIKKKSEQMP
jgi:hypothetical protein